MSSGAFILTLILIAITGATVWASATGFGTPQPVKQPISIREDSARPGRIGSRHYGIIYFGGGLRGGGLRGGK